jgi:hypothetical protein
MYNLKKRVPISALEAIQPLIDENRLILKPVFDSNFYFHLEDLDSDFFFKLSQNSDNIFVIDRKPYSQDTGKSGKVGAQNVSEVVSVFNDWISILKRYEIKTIFDDPIIKSYTEEFYDSLKMVDEDADEKPFDFVKQQHLIFYLEKAKAILETHKTEANKEIIEAIVEDCNNLEVELTQLPKNKVLEKLSQIWAKSRKQGWTIVKDLLSKFKEEAINTVVKHVLENANPENLWNSIQGLIGQ